MGKACRSVFLVFLFALCVLGSAARGQSDFDRFPFAGYRYLLTKTTTSDSTTALFAELQKGTVIVSEQGGQHRSFMDFHTELRQRPSDATAFAVTRTVMLRAPEGSYISMSEGKADRNTVVLEVDAKGGATLGKIYTVQYGEEAMPIVRGELAGGPSLRKLLADPKASKLSESQEAGMRVVRADVAGSPSTKVEFRLDPACDGRIVAIDWRIDAARFIMTAAIEYKAVKGVFFPSRVTVRANSGRDIRTEVMEISEVELDPQLPANQFTVKGLVDWVKDPGLTFLLQGPDGRLADGKLDADGKLVVVPIPSEQAANPEQRRIRLGLALLAGISILTSLLIAAAFALLTSRRKG